MKEELKNPKEEIEILIVEDSPLQAEILKSILEQHHYRHIVVANDGKEALALINKHKPTILISDIIMPEMDGYQLCRYIKADANLKDIPVILLTTLSNSKDVIKALECGANRFITKPYDEDYLLSNIQSILANRQLWKTEKVPMGVNIFFSGERYFITADPQQILDLLLSTYETAVRKNLELIQAQAELEAMNERLEEKVKERTAALIAEIAERKKVEEQLRKLSQAIEQSPSIVLILDTEGRIEYVNPKFSQITDYAPEEVVGLNLRDLSEQSPKEYQQMWKAITSGEEWRGEFRSKKKNGELYWELTSTSPIRNPEGIITHFLVVKEDITQRKRDEETILHMAYHDALTDLPNRSLLNDRLTQALVHARRNKQMLAVMFIDLDRFKTINDTLGHAIGDQLLQSVAKRLVNLLREGDTVARMGGDEFILLLPGITQAESAAKIAYKILEAFKPSFYFNDHELHVTSSIGIALYPDDGEDAETLLKNADTAMYRAKEQGRNNYQFYTPAMNATAFERLVLENNLRRALERKEFVIYYQPKICLQTEQIVGMEALVRWQHPELGLISPAKFIPLAEETGLIVPLGAWVLHTACTQSKTWQNAGFPPLDIAVNLSARQFQQPDLVEMVARVLEETGLAPYHLQLEITESIAMQNVEFTVKMLRKLKEMGIRILLDDFGVDYSSLSYLKRFPLHALKIDQSFMHDISTNSYSAMIITMIITLAHSLKLNVIAEGVETKEQLDFLKQLHCDEAQGYYFGPPISAEEFTQLLQKKEY